MPKNALRRLAAAAIILLCIRPAQAADLTLDDLILRALRQHPRLMAEQEALLAQEAREQAGSAAYWPQLTLNSGLSQTTSVSQAQNTAEPFNLASAGLTLRQQLLDFGRTEANLKALQAQSEVSRLQLAWQEAEVAHQVRRAYVAWLKAGGLEQQAKARLDHQKRLLEQAQALWKQGRRAKIDTTRAEASYQKAQTDWLDARAQRAAARVSLLAAVGNDDALPDGPQWPPLPGLAALSLKDLKTHLATHPMLQASQASLRQAQFDRQGAERSHWPTLSADATYGVRARNWAPNQNWGVGLNFNLPIFNGFRDQNEFVAAQARERQAEAEYLSKLNTLLADLERAHILLDGARRRIPAAESLQKVAQTNLQLAEGRYQAGVGSILEVSDAQRTLAEADTDWVAAQADLHGAIADLWRALGDPGVTP